MRKKIVITAVLLHVLSLYAYSQAVKKNQPPEMKTEKTKTEKAETRAVLPQNINQVGVAFSTFSGAGINYQRMFSEYCRISVSGFALYDRYRKISFTSAAGFGVQRDLWKSAVHKDFSMRLYAVAGISTWYIADYYGSRDKQTLAGGIGVGCELLMFEKFSVFPEIGYQYEHFLKPGGRYYTGFGGGIGAGFVF